MSGEKARAGITRRGFVKGAAALGAIGAAAGGMATASDWLAPAKAVAEPEEHTAYLCHQFHCLSECCLKCTVRDGRIAKIEPNDAVDEADRRICLRGIGEVQHVYAADRLQTPLRRVGERGEGKFESITWDEALKTIHDELEKVADKYGEDSIFFRKSTEAGEGRASSSSLTSFTRTTAASGGSTGERRTAGTSAAGAIRGCRRTRTRNGSSPTRSSSGGTTSSRAA